MQYMKVNLLLISRPPVSHHLRLMLNTGILYVSQTELERYYGSELEGTLDWLKELTYCLEKYWN